MLELVAWQKILMFFVFKKQSFKEAKREFFDIYIWLYNSNYFLAGDGKKIERFLIHLSTSYIYYIN